jgi:2-methylaconitate cis-trans-isomerase PrpF
MIQKIPCLIVRGGSSKGVFFERDDLPPPGPERDRVILSIYGSPDKRQIDGLGGADKLTSKTAVMGPPTRDDCDIDYLFGQVMIDTPDVEWESMCGNISAGAAVFAVYKGYVKSDGKTARVAIHQVNTNRRLLASVPVIENLPATVGDFVMGGVPGKSARIDLDFADFSSCILNRGILPTGSPRDEFDVPALGRIGLSVVDMGNFCIFVRAADVGLDHEQDIITCQADEKVIKRLEAIRKVVAAELGYITGPDSDKELKRRMAPLLFAVGPPRPYYTLNGKLIESDQYDLFSRSITRGIYSKTHPGSGSVGTGVSAGIEGTITAEMAGGEPRALGAVYKLRVGHPSGTLSIKARLNQNPEGEIQAEYAVLGRSARVLMEGAALLRPGVFSMEK